MKKSEFINELAQAAHLTKAQADRAFEATIALIEDNLVKGDTITFTGFGSFRKEFREAHIGRNPQTGDQLQVPAKYVVKFKPSKNLKAVVNGGDIGSDDEEE
jgi:DNA-binding protein HU-beta